MKFDIKIWFVYISNSTNLLGCVVVNTANLLEHEVNKLFHMSITLIFCTLTRFLCMILLGLAFENCVNIFKM
jgi:hypothetical protein